MTLEDLDRALDAAVAADIAAAAELRRHRAARRRSGMVGASALLPERGCSCGRALVLPGAPFCDLCTEEETRDPEVLAELRLAEPAAARRLRPAPPRLARTPRRAVGR